MLTPAEAKEKRPHWAQAMIVAEHHEDQSDIQTDYFNHTTTEAVFLAWSKHKRDLFPELRKAAASFPPTAHLGPGRDLYECAVVFKNDIQDNGSYYNAGNCSHWHGDRVTLPTLELAEAFIAAGEPPHSISFGGQVAEFEWRISKRSVEHREKWSMGHGYYLKAGFSDSTGWAVLKYRL